MDAAGARRALLPTRPNPEARLDYVVTLGGNLPGGIAVTVRYVPDRLLLDAGAFAAYLAAFATPAGVEELAVAVLADLNDVLVARWLHVAAASGAHGAIVEDRQPRWNNTALLQRLERI